jgi:hypothetical protein
LSSPVCGKGEGGREGGEEELVWFDGLRSEGEKQKGETQTHFLPPALPLSLHATYPRVEVRNQGIQEVGLRHHVAIKDDEELARRPLIENGIVQVPGLGVVGLAHLLDTAEVTHDHVVATGLVLLPDGIDQGTDVIAVLPVIADVHRDLVYGVVHRAGSHEGVADDFHRLGVAGDHHINRRLLCVGQRHVGQALAGAEDAVPDHEVRNEQAWGGREGGREGREGGRGG